MIPERLIEILRSSEVNEAAFFPPTEVFNEGWMLRLTLDAVWRYNISDHPLHFLSESKWYSEARLSSPFRPRSKLDSLGEGSTNADGVIGHFDFSVSNRAGLRLKSSARQFVVVEAKMFSNLSSGTTNALLYHQAARNVACMATAIEESGIALVNLESVGFFVIAPIRDACRARETNLESCLAPESIRAAVSRRIEAYESQGRKEISELREWERNFFHPLLDRLANERRLAVLSWEQGIADVSAVDRSSGSDLDRFYRRCLEFAPAPRSLAHMTQTAR